ncbi:MAG: beta-galactosidase GalA [Ferruginibacter sp.]
MKKILLLLTVTSFVHNIIFSQTRQKINFDEGWKFHLGHAADASKDFNYSIGNIFSKTGKGDKTAVDPYFNDSAWRMIQLPHDWAVELPFEKSSSFDVMAHGYKPVGGLFPQNSIGWYRKNFVTDRKDSGQRFTIQFDGIFRDSRVWINGIYLGNNMSGYIGSSYDITDFLNFNKKNTIVVRVDASQYEGWFYEGAGIYRHAWMLQTNNTHLTNEGNFVFSKVEKNKATISISNKILNQGLDASNCSIESFIADKHGNTVGKTSSQSISLKVNQQNEVDQQIMITDPKLWSIEDPYLYHVITLLKQGNKIIDKLNTRLGVRTIVMNNTDGLLLNGKAVKIKGVCCHQDHAGVGSALPDYLQYYRIKLLKEMGANAYRTSHNPPTPELLEACDSLGFLVLDETRLLNSGAEYLSQLEHLILRDRNHPSVFMWSIGNEEGWIHGTPTGRRIAQTMLAKQMELDPTRVSTYAADVGNKFQGVNEVIPVRGFNYRVDGVDPYHKDHPAQPVIGTEMGSTVTTRGIYIKDTINAYVPDQDITYPWWANTAEQWWSLAATRNWWMGGFVWTGFDYRGEPTPYEWPNINSHFGIMDMCGFPKNIYYYYQSWWSDKPVLHISPHWTWPGKEGQPIDVWINSNATEVELFLNEKSLGKKSMPRNSHLNWSVNYEPGTLKAVAFINGKKIETKVETTGKPVEVVITPYKTTMLADGKDAVVINVHAIDKEGREVPDANNLIRFTLTGDARPDDPFGQAKIIGVGNGDPSSHEPDKCVDGKWQRKLFNGKCQVIIQSGKNAGAIKFEAKADSLWTGSTDIILVSENNEVNGLQKKENASIKRVPEKMIGADISFLPQLESRGMKFSDKGIQQDPLKIMKDHGFNYIRLRLFNDPATDSGYSPKKGFCDLDQTKQMAKRVKDAGMKFLLDFHYSDYWADPGKQYKPAAWKNLNFADLKKALHDYTKNVLLELKAQGTLPQMVQIGNEINHGIVWPEGNINHMDSLAQLLKEGIAAVKEVDPSILIMIHIALGGQNDESVFFLDNMIARGVNFDVIGESYYPKWHSNLADLKSNLADLAKRYQQDIIVVEYSQLKKEVNDIVLNIPDNKGKGACIWEPLSTWEMIFDRDGKSNHWMLDYDEISKEFAVSKAEKK